MLYPVQGTENAEENERPETQVKQQENQPTSSSRGKYERKKQDPKIDEILEKIRNKMVSRGARGIIGLGKAFRIIDDDNSRDLNLSEFKKAIDSYRVGLNDEETKVIFKFVDRQGNGAIDYDEFLRSIRVLFKN